MNPSHFTLRREGVLGIGHQCVTFFSISVSYAVDDTGGGAREVVSDLNRSLGSHHFLYVMNEKTSFAY